MGNTCKPMADSFQCMTKFTTNKKKERKEKKKKAFLSDQCKEIEENNRMGKTRDLFKKIRDTKETLHAKEGKIRDTKDTIFMQRWAQ